MPAPRGVFALLVSFMVAFATRAAIMPPGLAAAGAAWPPSNGLVLAEVMTGGASASDEYVEIANAGSTDVDLGGCELIYVTASGTTTTRKASFGAPLLLVPGEHLLVANAAGIYGPLADSTYAGGLAADGGAVALRHIDGAVVDAVGWGTATNPYVEGAVAPAPPAKSSIERLPGGSGGNIQDTNDNRADWFVQPNPVPQSLVSTPVPGPSATPSATSTATPTESSSPIATGSVSPAPTAAVTSTPEPTGTTEPSPTPEPSPSAVPSPTSVPSPTLPAPTAPATLTPTPSPSIGATPSALPTARPSASSSPTAPAPELETIAAARAQPVGARVHVAGVVTVEPGLVGADGLLAIGDSSGGIFVRPSAPVEGLVVGRWVEIDGTLAAPYGQLEIRDLDAFAVGTDVTEPASAPAELADVGEGTEGSLVTIRGTVDSVQTDSGRLTITVADGTYSVRALADPPADLSRSDVARGDIVLATGIVGQHATATGRLDGYRLWLRRRADLVVIPSIQSPTASPVPSSTRAPIYGDLASALGTRGAAVDVEGVVTATAGLLDIGGATVVVDDGTAAVAVILPAATDVPSVGMRVRVTGKVGRWETGPTVVASQVWAEGELQAIGPQTSAGPLDSSLEWRLVRVCGRIDRFVPAGARWRVDMTVAGHAVTVLGEPAAAVALTKSSVGRLAVVVGIVRRSTSDSSAFQLLPRMALDFRLGPSSGALGAAAALSSARSSGARPGSNDASVGLTAPSINIGSLSAYLDQNVTVAGLVTDTESATATIDDGTGEVRLGGSSAADALAILEPGDAIEVTGLVQLDDQGLIVEADPASIVELPGDRADGPSANAGAVGLAANASTQLAAASLAAAASIRRASSAAPLPDGLAILAVLLVALGAAVAAWGVARYRARLRRIQVAISELRCVRSAHVAHRWPRLGRPKGT